MLSKCWTKVATYVLLFNLAKLKCSEKQNIIMDTSKSRNVVYKMDA